MNKKYVFSDLICETASINKTVSSDDVVYQTITNHGYEIQRTNVKTSIGEQASGISIGKYSTVYFNKITNADSEQRERLSLAVADEIKALLPQKCESIMVAGLGNQYMTSDSIGPKTVSKISITRHISIYHKDIFESMKTKKISALAPGVLSQTGIESAEIFSGMSKKVHPDAVIVIDSLCARAPERLAATVQISNVGITPGGGIGNKRRTIDQNTLGCPVISVGIPTIVSSATLVHDALEKSGTDIVSYELEQILENGKSFYVTLNEVDEITDVLSDMLSESLYYVAEK